MLIIRDDIDLVELKKFGFKKHKKDPDHVILSKWASEKIFDYEDICSESYSLHSFPIIELVQTGYGLMIVLVAKWDFIPNALEIIFDLFCAGIVKKV